MGILQSHYENARRATDYARRRVFEVRAHLDTAPTGARRDASYLEEALVGAERDLADTVAFEAAACRRLATRVDACRQRRPVGAVVTSVTSVGATVRAKAAATSRAAQSRAQA